MVKKKDKDGKETGSRKKAAPALPMKKVKSFDEELSKKKTAGDEKEKKRKTAPVKTEAPVAAVTAATEEKDRAVQFGVNRTRRTAPRARKANPVVVTEGMILDGETAQEIAEEQTVPVVQHSEPHSPDSLGDRAAASEEPVPAADVAEAPKLGKGKGKKKPAPPPEPPARNTTLDESEPLRAQLGEVVSAHVKVAEVSSFGASEASDVETRPSAENVVATAGETPAPHGGTPATQRSGIRAGETPAVLGTASNAAQQVASVREAARQMDIHFVGDQDRHFWNQGTHRRAYEKLGAHALTIDGRSGIHFAVWAPSAHRVSVIGDFNDWNPDATPMQALGDSGLWAAYSAEAKKGSRYKYRIEGPNGYVVDKADPFAFWAEVAPKTASVVWDLDYEWNDQQWMSERAARQALDRPISIYEIHLGSWRRVPEENNRPLTYREMARPLCDYMEEMGFTHAEFLPVMEHPFYGSWGYQGTGYFAATSRYGTPQDLMYLIDQLHQRGFGVILDWVPSHFPGDEHGLAYFDGTHAFEHADPRQGFHPDWQSYIFNYGRNEVRSFLLSSAIFWLDRFHVDGLRVDAVASMLYLDYSRKAGHWVPNKFGGRENLEAISFLQQTNDAVHAEFPGTVMIAEESTAWPLVSRPSHLGGLGFTMKWDMGWMHDTLKYMALDPILRKFHHDKLTFRQLYAYSENFVLSLSHDEVVHMKGSLVGKMPGDMWQKFANLRLLYGYMYGQTGKKLIFMGSELGTFAEWNHDKSLDWHLRDYPFHEGTRRWLADLNRAYRDTAALHQLDNDPLGFEWIDCNDNEQSIISFVRHGKDAADDVIGVFNFTPIPRFNYQIGAPRKGYWKEILNSDASDYGGSGMGNMGGVEAAPVPAHGRNHSLTITLPPLSAIFFQCQEPAEPRPVEEDVEDRFPNG